MVKKIEINICELLGVKERQEFTIENLNDGCCIRTYRVKNNKLQFYDIDEWVDSSTDIIRILEIKIDESKKIFDESEIEFCKKVDKRFKYVTKDSDNNIEFWEEEPNKDDENRQWLDNSDFSGTFYQKSNTAINELFGVFSLFESLSADDDEATKIEDIINQGK